MSYQFIGETHTTEGMPTNAYMDWCQTFYTTMGVYDSDELKEAKRRLMIADAYKLLKLLKEDNKLHYIFLTINPPPNITFQNFKIVIEKLMSKKWITNSLYVYEQRSETIEELGRGFHFHALIKRPEGKPNFQIQREMKNSVKNILDVDKHTFFNLKYISYEESLRKQIYILGQKADEAKHQKQKMDILFRHKENIKSYYNNNYIIEECLTNEATRIPDV